MTDRLLFLRMHESMTIRQFASKINATKKEVNNWESGKDIPSFLKQKEIIEIFSLPLSFFDKENNNFKGISFETYRELIEQAKRENVNRKPSKQQWFQMMMGIIVSILSITLSAHLNILNNERVFSNYKYLHFFVSNGIILLFIIGVSGFALFTIVSIRMLMVRIKNKEINNISKRLQQLKSEAGLIDYDLVSDKIKVARILNKHDLLEQTYRLKKSKIDCVCYEHGYLIPSDTTIDSVVQTVDYKISLKDNTVKTINGVLVSHIRKLIDDYEKNYYKNYLRRVKRHLKIASFLLLLDIVGYIIMDKIYLKDILSRVNTYLAYFVLFISLILLVLYFVVVIIKLAYRSLDKYTNHFDTVSNYKSYEDLGDNIIKAINDISAN